MAVCLSSSSPVLFLSPIVAIVIAITKDKQVNLLLESTPIYLPLFLTLSLTSLFSVGFCFATFFQTTTTLRSYFVFIVLCCLQYSAGVLIGLKTCSSNGIAELPVLFYYLGGIFFPSASILQGFSTLSRHFNLKTSLSPGTLFTKSLTGIVPVILLLTQLSSIVFYFVLFLYFQQITPSKYGHTQPWYFPFQRGFLFVKMHLLGVNTETETYDVVGNQVKEEPSNEQHTIFEYEKDIFSNDAVVVISDLRKEYLADGLPTVTLKCLSLSIFHGEILAVLGPKSAGKTTLTDCLIGKQTPTSGNIIIFDKSIADSREEVNRITGISQPHNMLLDRLTVLEHFQFFGGIRGIDQEEIMDSAHVWTQTIGLKGNLPEQQNGLSSQQDKTNHLISSLSTLEKRKLSIALAFFGEPKLVILDEPSAELDVESRQHIWELIRTSHQQQTIIITTSLMEDAELCDRIAILAHGALQCVGTPAFLKRKFNKCYSLLIMYQKDSSVSNQSQCIRNIIKALAPYAMFHQTVGLSLKFLLPMKHSSEFPLLMNELDSRTDELRINTIRLFREDFHSIYSTATKRSVMFSEFCKVNNDVDMCNGDSLDELEDLEESSKANQLARLFSRAAEESSTTGTLSPVGFIHSTWLICSRRIDFKRSMIFWGYFVLFIFFVSDTIFSNSVSRTIPLTQRKIGEYGMFALNMPRIPAKLLHPPALILSNPSNPFDEDVFSAAWTPQNSMIFPVSFARDAFHWPSKGNSRIQDWVDIVSNNFSDYYVKNIYSTDQQKNRYFFSVLIFEMNNLPGLRASTLTSTASSETTKATILIEYNRELSTSPNIGLNSFSNVVLSTVYRDIDRVVIKPHLRSLPMKSGYNAPRLSWLISFEDIFFLHFAIFCVPILLDVATGNRHMYFIFGAPSVAYWIGNFLADLFFYLVFVLACAVSISIYGIDYFMQESMQFFLSALILLGGIHAILLVYVLTFVFHGLGYILIVLQFFLISVLGGIFIDFKFGEDSIVEKVLKLHPSFLFSTATNFFQFIIRLNLPSSTLWNFQKIFLNKFLWYILLTILLLVVLEYFHIGRKLWTGFYRWKNGRIGVEYHDADSFVFTQPSEQEMEQGHQLELDDGPTIQRTAPLVLNHLRQQYQTSLRSFFCQPGVFALDDVSFCVEKGERFGLLSVHEFGTVAMRLMIGQELPLSGAVYISGVRVDTNPTIVRQGVGFCPKTHVPYEDLTVLENLVYFAKLRGYSSQVIQWFSLELATLFGLHSYLHTNVSWLCPNDKRKLSLAISFFGNPSLLFLDNPALNHDLGSSIEMWTLISSVANDTSVVLTSVRPDDLDVLCDRIGVLSIKGKMKYIGSPYELRSRYCPYYVVTTKVPEGKDDVVKSYILESFPGAKVSKSLLDKPIFIIPKLTPLSSIVKALEDWTVNDEIGIQSYSVGNAPLYVALRELANHNIGVNDASSGVDVLD